jgi:hypothetical protein
MQASSHKSRIDYLSRNNHQSVAASPSRFIQTIGHGFKPAAIENKKQKKGHDFHPQDWCSLSLSIAIYKSPNTTIVNIIFSKNVCKFYICYYHLSFWFRRFNFKQQSKQFSFFFFWDKFRPINQSINQSSFNNNFNFSVSTNVIVLLQDLLLLLIVEYIWKEKSCFFQHQNDCVFFERKQNTIKQKILIIKLINIIYPIFKYK